MNPYTLKRPWSTHLWISIGAGLFLVALTGLWLFLSFGFFISCRH